jgi:hypothetical protein
MISNDILAHFRSMEKLRFIGIVIVVIRSLIVWLIGKRESRDDGVLISDGDPTHSWR